MAKFARQHRDRPLKLSYRFNALTIQRVTWRQSDQARDKRGGAVADRTRAHIPVVDKQSSEPSKP